jgi:hypothetical protein
MAKGNIVLNMTSTEDGPRMLDMLTFFDKNKSKPQWTGPKDINQYKNWRELEDIVEKSQNVEFKSGKEQRKETGEGAKLLYEVEVPSTQKPVYKFYQILEPEALARMSYGTRWCTGTLDDKIEDDKIDYTYPEWHPNAGKTRTINKMKLGEKTGYPNAAISYIKISPLYMIFRSIIAQDTGRSGQVLNITGDGTQIMGSTNEPILRISASFDYAISKWVESGTCPIVNIINKIRMTRPNYKGRLPIQK